MHRLAYSFSRLYIFAGQGTQSKGMLKTVLMEQRAKEVSQAINAQFGMDLGEVGSTDVHGRMNQTEITQPLLMLSHYLHFQQYELHSEDYLIGHSLGEYSALVIAGSLTLIDGLRLVRKRGELMTKHTLTPHGMLIVNLPSENTQLFREAIKQEDVEIACYNTKNNLIVAGEKEKLHRLHALFKKSQIGSMLLPVSTAFHCKMLASMCEEFKEQLDKIEFKVPKCTILRNLDGEKYESGIGIREGLLRQLTNPVRFYESVLRVPRDYPWIEVGHKAYISRFVEEIRKCSSGQF